MTLFFCCCWCDSRIEPDSCKQYGLRYPILTRLAKSEAPFPRERWYLLSILICLQTFPDTASGTQQDLKRKHTFQVDISFLFKAAASWNEHRVLCILTNTALMRCSMEMYSRSRAKYEQEKRPNIMIFLERIMNGQHFNCVVCQLVRYFFACRRMSERTPP